MFNMINHWMRDLGLVVARYFSHLSPEKYSHMLLAIVVIGWLLLGGSNRR